jgi:hypothetical protein
VALSDRVLGDSTCATGPGPGSPGWCRKWGETREDEIARKVLVKHLQSGNSYGIALKDRHCKFPQPELGPWVEDSRIVGTNWTPPVLGGWEPPQH